MADNGSAKGGTGAYTINLENFSKRLKVFYDHWKEHKSDLWRSSDAIVIVTPALDAPPHLKSVALEIWLLGYEFPETIIVFMKNQIHVLCSQKKANIIRTLEKAANEAVGADIVLHVKTKNSDGSYLMDDIVRAAQTRSKSDKPVVGHIANEVDGGKLLQTWAAKLSSYGIRPSDVTNGFSELFAVKDTTEITCVKKAACLTSSVLENFVVPKLMKVITKEEKVSHSSLRDETVKAILDPLKIKEKLNPDNVDICYPPVFQSGGKFDLKSICYPPVSQSGSKFDLKPGASSKDEYLYYDSASVIICAIGSKYSNYCSNVARTYLIDASPAQSKAYETLLKAHEAAVAKVKPGSQMSAVYQAARAVIERDAPELLPNLTMSAGSGIGLEFQESVLNLNANNDGRVKQGMVFNVSLGLHNIQAETTTAEKTKQFSLLLADTVLVNERGPSILTAPCSKAVKDVAYQFSKDAVKMERMKKIMNMKENIRNICIFGPGQANIVKALSSDPTLLAPEMMSDAIARGDEPVALYYRLGKGPRDTFLVNVTQCPEVTDSSMEFNASLSIVDGTLIRVELNEGFTLQCESFLRQALYESVIPLLCIDVPDIANVLKDLKEGEQVPEAYGEEIYCKLSKLIKKANDIGDKYENKLLDDVTFDPRKANVCFSSSSSGWAFTLNDLARFWSPILGVNHSLLVERLWGENFYDPESKKWSKVHTETSKRGFPHFCINLIMIIYQHCLKGDQGKLEALFFGDTVKDQQQFVGKVGTSLYKEFIKKFLPAGRTFKRMIIWKLPSAQRAQKYRVDHLYSGPVNDRCAAAIKTCNSKGPLMLFISKIVTDAKTHEPIAIGRVYSGTVRTGMEVNILGPAAEEKDAVGQSFEIDPIMWIGNRQQQVKTVHCGNVIGMRGIHQLAKVGCTVIANKCKMTFPIRPISFYLMNNMQIKDVTLDPIDDLNQIIPSNGTRFSLPYAVYNGLFSHQREGMFWLWQLHCTNRGGILADDMGLGKSRQVSAFLRGLFNSNLISKAIIVAPLSVIYQWKPELTKVGLQSKM
jgi:Xaa-Pro aminopeptidase